MSFRLVRSPLGYRGVKLQPSDEKRDADLSTFSNRSVDPLRKVRGSGLRLRLTRRLHARAINNSDFLIGSALHYLRGGRPGCPRVNGLPGQQRIDPVWRE